MPSVWPRRLRRRASVLVTALLAATVPTAAAVRPVAAQPPDSTRFEGEIQAFEAADRAHPPAPGGVVFVGSSSVRLWCALDRDFPAARVVNRGFGGSTSAEVVRYAPRIVLPYRPRTVVVYAGDNDLAEGRTPADVQSAFRRLAAIVHAGVPEARLVILAVKPSPARVQLLAAVRATNALLAADVRRDPRATFVDVYTPMLGADGRPRGELFGGDGLHMNSAGYALWRERLAPVLAATPASGG